MTDEERKQFCNVLRGSDGKYFASKAADEIENLDAARLNNEYQRDTALAELKDANERLEGLAERVKQYYDKGGQLEADIEARKRMRLSPTRPDNEG